MEILENRYVEVTEVVQCGDSFLLHFSCDICLLRNFSSFPLEGRCDLCKCLYPKVLKFPKSRSGFRLVVGTRRKAGLRYHKKTIATLLEIQGRCCAYCDKELEDYHIEHIIPLSVGGTNNMGNLCLACPRCNLMASDLVFENLYLKKLYVMKTLRDQRVAKNP